MNGSADDIRTRTFPAATGLIAAAGRDAATTRAVSAAAALRASRDQTSVLSQGERQPIGALLDRIAVGD